MQEYPASRELTESLDFYFYLNLNNTSILHPNTKALDFGGLFVLLEVKTHLSIFCVLLRIFSSSIDKPFRM